MKFALIGCGFVGSLRARALAGLSEPGVRLVHCVDPDRPRAERTASPHPGCDAGDDWHAPLERMDVDAVIVSTPHDALAEIARAALAAGKHVFLEKPAARRTEEIADLPALAASRGLRVRVGFNLRHHRSFRQARDLVDSGVLGDLMFVRARYGHGGRVGY